MSSAKPQLRRGQLNKSRILKAAATIMRKHGAKALTIRKLAEHLDAAPMSIYRHFKDKDALLSALLNEFIADAKVLPSEKLPWDQWLKYIGLRMYEAQVAHPVWSGLLGSFQVPHQGLVILNRCMDVMTHAGFSNEQALNGFFHIVQVSMGASLLQSGLEKLNPATAFDADSGQEIVKLLQRFNGVEAMLPSNLVEQGLELVVLGLQQQLATDNQS